MDVMEGVAKKQPKPLDTEKKHSLGNRAFLVFLFKRIKLPIIMFVLAWGAWYAERWVPPQYSEWGYFSGTLVLDLAIAVSAFIVAQTYLEYRYYTYSFTEDAFVMTYGYYVRNEVATLYHHIQNVNIERSILDRAIGVSKLVIMMTGSDRDTRRNQIVLPAVGKRKAKLVQIELLRRARRHAEARFEADDRTSLA